MDISRSVSEDGNHEGTTSHNINRILGEVQNPPLNLPLTKTPELINMIESAMKQNYPCHHKQKSVALCPPGTPNEKQKALNFPISKITIGEWTRDEQHPEDLKAKFYFRRKKLMWEILNKVEPDRLKRKIEIQWDDVLSLKTTYLLNTEILEIELSRRPTFFTETPPQQGKHTQWKQMDHDFTTNQSTSFYRRHTLHFPPGVWQNNLEKLEFGDSFWSKLIKVPFPTLQNPYFDFDYDKTVNFNVDNVTLYHQSQGFDHVGVREGNPNTTTQSGAYDFGSSSNSNAADYNHDKKVSLNVNNDILYHQPQGFDHVGVIESNLNMATQFGAYDGRLRNTFVQANNQNNTTNQLFGMQAIQPSSQMINEHYHMGRYFNESDFGMQINTFVQANIQNNPMIQDLSQMRNTRESLGGPLLETQSISTMCDEISVYGPYVQDIFHQHKGENMVHTQLNDNFQKNGNHQYRI